MGDITEAAFQKPLIQGVCQQDTALNTGCEPGFNSSIGNWEA